MNRAHAKYFSVDNLKKKKTPHENIKKKQPFSNIWDVWVFFAIFRFGAISTVMETQPVIVFLAPVRAV